MSRISIHTHVSGKEFYACHIVLLRLSLLSLGYIHMFLMTLVMVAIGMAGSGLVVQHSINLCEYGDIYICVCRHTETGLGWGGCSVDGPVLFGVLSFPSMILFSLLCHSFRS